MAKKKPTRLTKAKLRTWAVTLHREVSVLEVTHVEVRATSAEAATSRALEMADDCGDEIAWHATSREAGVPSCDDTDVVRMQEERA